MKSIVTSTYFRAVDRNRQNDGKQRKRLFVAPAERPDNEEVIEASLKHKRFK